MTLAYTNCICSSDKQKVFYLSGLWKLTVENLLPPPTSIPLPYPSSSRNLLRASTLLHCIRKSENMPQNNPYLFCLHFISFALHFKFLSLSPQCPFISFSPYWSCSFLPYLSLIVAHPTVQTLFSFSQISKQLNLALLYPSMSLLSHPSSA